MINKDFSIDFDDKKISYIGKGKQAYSVLDFYSFLQDTFDEPENMQYDIPIIARNKTDFALTNGWTMDAKSLSFVKGSLHLI